MLHAFKADEGGWRQVCVLHRAESTPYVGRAVAAPARAGRVMRESGRTLVVGELACGYGLRTSTASRAAVPGAAHSARLGILGEQHLDLRAHGAEVLGVGR